MKQNALRKKNHKYGTTCRKCRKFSERESEGLGFDSISAEEEESEGSIEREREEEK